MDQPTIPLPSTQDRKERYEYAKKSYLSQFKTTGYKEVRATPLVEVFSVTIYTNQCNLYDDGEPCQIYGTIRVKDTKGTYVELYNQELTEPEIVYNGGALSLTGPKNGAISSCGALEVEIELKDKARDVEVVKDVLGLDHKTRDDYEKVITKHVPGKYGSVAVCYIIYQSAVIANVEVSFRNKEDTCVYGTVCACCVKADEYPFNDFEEEYSKKKEFASSILFQRPATQPARVKGRTSLVLSRPIVAVPAHSCLIVEVNLSSCDAQPKNVSGTMKFLAKHQGNVMKSLMEPNGQDLVRGVVLWSHALVQHSLRRELLWVEDAFSKKRVESQVKQCKMIRSLSGKRPQLAYPLIEVFSISIGSHHNQVMNIYGTIKVRDENGSRYIFEKGQNSPVVLHPNDKLSCLGLRSFRGCEFCMDFDLYDVKGRIVSKGKINWDKDKVEVPVSWYDSLFCSVIPGERSYVRVHYTILSSGLQARVSVRFFANDSSLLLPASVYGSLVAMYNTYEYLTYYESEYYKSELFARDSKDPLLVSSGCEIPLSKSEVSLAMDSSLVIEVNLHAVMGHIMIPSERGDTSGISGRTDSWCEKFMVVTDKRGTFRRQLGGSYYHIDLMVEM